MHSCIKLHNMTYFVRVYRYSITVSKAIQFILLYLDSVRNGIVYSILN